MIRQNIWSNASLKWQAADFVNLWARGEYRSERARFTSNYAESNRS